MKIIKTSLFLVVIILIFSQSCETKNKRILNLAKEYTYSHSFNFLDKKGLVCGYDLEFETKGIVKYNATEQNQLFSTTRKVFRTIAGKFELRDLVVNRDSIEQILIENTQTLLLNDGYNTIDIYIKNIVVPEPIYKALISRYLTINRIRPPK